MKRWIKRTLIGLLATGALFGGLAAWAHKSYHHRFGWNAISEADAAEMKGRIIEKVGSKLDLDAGQKARLGLLADALREQRNAFVASSADPRTEAQGLIAGNTFDRAKAQQFINAKTAVVNSGSPAVIAAMADFYDSLRPDQQAKVREMLSRMPGHRSGRG